MNNPKLLEAISELEAQREIIDNAILHLRKAVEALSGEGQGNPAAPRVSSSASRSGVSYTAQAEQAILAAGHPLHIKEIIEYIGQIRGEKPPRSSVESGILRDIRKYGDSCRIVRSGKSTYDVRKQLSIAS